MEDERPIPISALQHYSFCPRQCGLIHLEQCFEDNSLTIRGHAVHRRVVESDHISVAGIRVEYSLPIFSEKLGIVGLADAVEFPLDGAPYPIEYKHGTRAARIHDDVQLAAQAMCLEEMTGMAVTKGAIYHYSSRRRREVDISSSLRDTTQMIVVSVRLMLEQRKLPPPIYDGKCNNCSLIELCQPRIVQGEGHRSLYSLLSLGDL